MTLEIVYDTAEEREAAEKLRVELLHLYNDGRVWDIVLVRNY